MSTLIVLFAWVALGVVAAVLFGAMATKHRMKRR